MIDKPNKLGLSDSFNEEYENFIKVADDLSQDILRGYFEKKEHPDKTVRVGPSQREVNISEVNNVTI